jgi:hypothetical protein
MAAGEQRTLREQWTNDRGVTNVQGNIVMCVTADELCTDHSIMAGAAVSYDTWRSHCFHNLRLDLHRRLDLDLPRPHLCYPSPLR